MPTTWITRVEFSNFKALETFSIGFKEMNILVGANNAGKSTILSAFRMLASVLPKARSKNPTYTQTVRGIVPAYQFPLSAASITTDNIHTDLRDVDAAITFTLSNSNRLVLSFPQDGSFTLIPVPEGRPLTSAGAFRQAYPISIVVVPTLGPVEGTERLRAPETVQTALSTHVAAHHFRNYWYYFPDGFPDFAASIARSWPGVEIEAPVAHLGVTNTTLTMMYSENRILRELYWSGFGFQAWCQLLTHLHRAHDSTMVVIDEPDTYLHPELQRQLLSILRELGPHIVLATHSAELIAESDLAELLLIDKSRQSAKRVTDIQEVQRALNAVGSLQNVTLTRLARNRRILFLEGDDFGVLRLFARKLGMLNVANSVDFTPITSDGFSSWERVKALGWGIKKALGESLNIAAIYDRDYWSADFINFVLAELQPHITWVHVLARKEIENYLLVPSALQRTVERARREAIREGRLTEETAVPDVAALITQITNDKRTSIEAAYIEVRSRPFRGTRTKDDAVEASTVEWIDAQWPRLETRLDIVPGKEILRSLRSALQDALGISLTTRRIVESFTAESVPGEVRQILEGIDTFRRSAL